MRRFAWSEEKDAWLREVRGVGFEDVLFSLARGGLLDVLAHPNQERYPGQRILVVEIDEYAWLVPFVEDENVGEIFLKTIIPSRRATREHLQPLTVHEGETWTD